MYRAGNPLYNPFPCHYVDLIFPRFTYLKALSPKAGFWGRGEGGATTTWDDVKNGAKFR